jgi:hypothetical protein
MENRTDRKIRKRYKQMKMRFYAGYVGAVVGSMIFIFIAGYILSLVLY